jgi:hypothetical protein
MGKFALRAQSMARELAPKGIHVAHFVIDGSVRNAEKGRVEGANMAADSYLDPEAIAQSYLHVVQQPRRWSCALGSSGSEAAAPLRAPRCEARSSGGSAHLLLHVEDRRQGCIAPETGPL